MSRRTEHSKKVWLVVAYDRRTGEKLDHSQFYSKRGLAVNYANKHWGFCSYGRADVLEYDLSDPTIVHSTHKETSS